MLDESFLSIAWRRLMPKVLGNGKFTCLAGKEVVPGGGGGILLVWDGVEGVLRDQL